MRAMIATALLGEGLLLTGLYFMSWPVALVIAGAQLVGVAAFVDFGGDE